MPYPGQRGRCRFFGGSNLGVGTNDDHGLGSDEAEAVRDLRRPSVRILHCCCARQRQHDWRRAGRSSCGPVMPPPSRCRWIEPRLSRANQIDQPVQPQVPNRKNSVVIGITGGISTGISTICNRLGQPRVCLAEVLPYFDSSRAASAEVARDGDTQRIGYPGDFGAVATPTVVGHRAEDRARARRSNSQRCRLVAIGRLHGELAARRDILRTGDLDRIHGARDDDGSDHPATKAMDRAIVGDGPSCGEGMVENESGILHPRIPHPIGVPRCPRGRTVATEGPNPLDGVSRLNRYILRGELQPALSDLYLEDGSVRTQQRQDRGATDNQCEFNVMFHR